MLGTRQKAHWDCPAALLPNEARQCILFVIQKISSALHIFKFILKGRSVIPLLSFKLRHHTTADDTSFELNASKSNCRAIGLVHIGFMSTSIIPRFLNDLTATIC